MKTNHNPSVIVAPEGDLIRLTHNSTPSKPVKVEHKRGSVVSFSRRSRSRLMMKLAIVKKHQVPCFVTLTYPAEFPTDYEVYKYHVHKFFIYLLREFPSAGVIWKLEYQARGAAHFHLFVWGVEFSLLRDFVPSLWSRIAGGGDPYHALFHTGELPGSSHCVQLVKSWRGVRSYASKYFSKLDETTDKTGRFWGVRGLVPFSQLLSFTIDMQSALDFKRSIRRAFSFKSQRLGFWSYGFSADWLIYLDYLCNKNISGIPEPPPRWLLPPAPASNVSFF